MNERAGCFECRPSHETDDYPAVIRQWTGREANALRRAARLSVRDFAEHLGVSARAVSRWAQLGADTVPRPYMQAILDTALAQADEQTQRRFDALLAAALVDNRRIEVRCDEPASTTLRYGLDGQRTVTTIESTSARQMWSMPGPQTA